MASLVVSADALAQDAGTVRRIGIRLGALSGADAAYVRESWARLVTPRLAGAELDIQVVDDLDDEASGAVTIAYVDVADEEP